MTTFEYLTAVFDKENLQYEIPYLEVWSPTKGMVEVNFYKNKYVVWTPDQQQRLGTFEKEEDVANFLKS